MITAIVGDIGAGKTSLATAMACERMTFDALDDMRSLRREVAARNAGGFKLTVPENAKHLVFANYPIETRCMGFARRKSWEVDGFRIGLPNPDYHTDFIPPYSLIILDEAQRYYKSKGEKGKQTLPDNVSRYYELSRHMDIDFILILQRFMLLEKNIRDLVTRIIIPQDMHIKTNSLGWVKSVEWDFIEFKDSAAAENYVNGKEGAAGTAGKYIFNGDIFRCYESKIFRSLFYENKANVDFDFEECCFPKKDIQSVADFCKKHGCSAPAGFDSSHGYEFRGVY